MVNEIQKALLAGKRIAIGGNYVIIGSKAKGEDLVKIYLHSHSLKQQGFRSPREYVNFLRLQIRSQAGDTIAQAQLKEYKEQVAKTRAIYAGKPSSRDIASKSIVQLRGGPAWGAVPRETQVLEKPMYPYQPIITSKPGEGLTAKEIFAFTKAKGYEKPEYYFSSGVGTLRSSVDYRESVPLGIYQPGKTKADAFILSRPGEGLTAAEILAVGKVKGRKTLGETLLTAVPAWGRSIASPKTVPEYSFVKSAEPGVLLYGVTGYKEVSVPKPVLTKERGIEILKEASVLGVSAVNPLALPIAMKFKPPKEILGVVSDFEARYISPRIVSAARTEDFLKREAGFESRLKPLSPFERFERVITGFEIGLREDFVAKPLTEVLPAYLTDKYVSIGVASFEEAGITLPKLFPALAKRPVLAKGISLGLGVGALGVVGGVEAYQIATAPSPARRAGLSIGRLAAFGVGARAAQNVLKPVIEDITIKRAYSETVLPLSPKQFPTDIPGIKPRLVFSMEAPKLNIFRTSPADIEFLKTQVDLLGRAESSLPFKYEVLLPVKKFPAAPRAYAVPDVVFDFDIGFSPKFPAAPKTYEMPFDLGDPFVQRIFSSPKSSVFVYGDIKSDIGLRTRTYFGNIREYVIQADTKSFVGDILTKTIEGKPVSVLSGRSKTDLVVSRLVKGKPEFLYRESLPSEFEVISKDFGQEFNIATLSKKGEFLGVGRRAVWPQGGYVSFDGGVFQSRKFISTALEYGGKQESSLLKGKIGDLRIVETTISKERGFILPGFERALYAETGGGLPRAGIVKRGAIDVGLEKELDVFAFSRVKSPVPEGTFVLKASLKESSLPFQKLIISKRGGLFPAEVIAPIKPASLEPMDILPFAKPISLLEGVPVQVSAFSIEEAGIARVLSGSSLKLFPVPSIGIKPSLIPSLVPKTVPVSLPIQSPIQVPSILPVQRPVQVPEIIPSQISSQIPSLIPSQIPVQIPSQVPSLVPSLIPSQVPSLVPSLIPSPTPPPRVPLNLLYPSFKSIEEKRLIDFELPIFKEGRIDVIPLSDLLSINITEIFKRGGKATQPRITEATKLEFDIGIKSGRLIFPTLEQKKGLIPEVWDVFKSSKKGRKRRGMFDLIPKIEV